MARCKRYLVNGPRPSSAPSALRLFIFLVCVIAFSALTPLLAHAEGYGRISNSLANGQLQVSAGRIAYKAPPPDGQLADWQFENGGPNTFRLRNRKSNLYLTHKNGQVALVANGVGDPASLWELIPTGSPARFQMRPAGSDLTFVATGNNAPVALEPATNADKGSQWTVTWSEMPSFAIERLDKIEDWTKTDRRERNGLLIAAAALVLANDNAKSLELKGRWARIFPYVPAPGPVNKGTDIVLSGRKLDSGSMPFYVAETRVRYTTGLYAVPGEEITLTVPEAFVTKGAQLQIGHVDGARIQNERTNLGRFPYSLVTSAAIDSAAEQETGNRRKVRLRNGFGGIVYIIGHAGFDPGDTRINIAGGVRMPMFQLGKTDLEAWRREIRTYPAPWAEISSASAAVTLPSEMIRKLEQPNIAATGLEDVLRYQDDFVGFRPLRKYPHRVDTDIVLPPGVAGYNGGHVSTVPFGWMETYLNPNEEFTGNWWGLYHEIGHGHQAPTWNRIGNNADVSNNIVLLYARHMFRPSETGKAMALMTLQARRDSFKEVRANFALDQKGRQGRWVDGATPDYFGKLTMFAWLSDQFGWQTFVDAFRAYHAPGFAAPKDIPEQHATLLVELSRATKIDLSAYFELWGAPVSDDARVRIAAIRTGANRNEPLPKWAPDATGGITFELSMPPVTVKPSSGPGVGFLVRNFRFAGSHGDQGSVIWKTSGGKASVSLQYDPACPPCKGSSQILLGVRGTRSGELIWSGEPRIATPDAGSNAVIANWNGTVEIPAKPGGYEICVRHAQSTDASAALAEAKAAEFRDCETVGLALVGAPPTVARVANPTVPVLPGTPARNPASAVNALNVTTVLYATGALHMTGPRQWIEEASNNRKFVFAEEKRDELSVVLFDAGREIRLQLDLNRRRILFSEKNSPFRPFYVITSTSSAGSPSNTAGPPAISPQAPPSAVPPVGRRP